MRCVVSFINYCIDKGRSKTTASYFFVLTQKVREDCLWLCCDDRTFAIITRKCHLYVAQIDGVTALESNRVTASRVEIDRRSTATRCGITTMNQSSSDGVDEVAPLGLSNEDEGQEAVKQSDVHHLLG